MCGRFSLSGEIDLYAEYFGAIPTVSESLEPSWNVAPTDPVYVVAERDGRRSLGTMRWGHVPHWAADLKTPSINARIETVAVAAAFRDSFARRRCLIPADGFYEWEPRERGGHPHWIFRADGYPLGLAGVWSSWHNPADGSRLSTCAILTAPATGVIAGIHGRMPVAISPEAWDGWLDRDLSDPDLALGLLTPLDPSLWMEREVSARVNSVRNNGPELQDPAGQARLL